MGTITLLDGAFGTRIWDKTGDDKPVWTYNITQPHVIAEVTREYAEAGSQIIQANTFGANRLAVEKSSDYTVEEVVTAAVAIAKEAVEGTGIRIALSAGPLTEMMEPYGDLTEEEVEEIYDEMFAAGIRAGADLIQLETFMDLDMLAVVAARAKSYGVPVICTMSFEASGMTMFGNSVEDLAERMEEIGVDATGLNCSLGPEQAVPIIKALAGATSLPLAFKPNAGLPVLAADGSKEVPYSKDDFARELAEAVPLVAYLGGCCGTDPSYISCLKDRFL